MIIKKSFKFYAAHRNEEIGGKCANLHGHRYGIECFFEVRRQNSISTPFAEFDERVGRLISENYDHGMLIHRADPLYRTLNEHMQTYGEHLKLKLLEGPTSVENLAYTLFSEISAIGFQLLKIEVRETDTSVVEYTLSDWKSDRAKFAWGRDATEGGADHLQLAPVASYANACVTVLDAEA